MSKETDTESRVVLARTNQVIARFDGPDGYRNFQASIRWAKQRGYSAADVICGPGSRRDIGWETVPVIMVKP